MVLDAVGFANGDFDSKLGDATYAVEKLQQATNHKGFKDARILTDLGRCLIVRLGTGVLHNVLMKLL